MDNINIIEENVPAYRLPDPLLLPTGEKITHQHEWFGLQRPLILKYFQREVFGVAATEPYDMTCDVRNYLASALGGTAIRKEVRLHFQLNEKKAFMDMLIYLPLAALDQPAKVFLGLNFTLDSSILSAN